jgi:hypothetical protein
MPDDSHHDEHERGNPSGSGTPAERTFIHRILRYVPNLLRDEWVNIGVLLYDPNTGERRLRLIEDTTEFNRVRRLHPRFDESALRGLRDHLESRFGAAMTSNGNGGPIRGTLRNGEGNPKPNNTEWVSILEKWDATLSQSLQLADAKGTIAEDLDEEVDRLYDERVAVIAAAGRARIGAPNARAGMRRYCEQVFRQARIRDHIDKTVRIEEFTFAGDPMRIDYGYWRNEQKIRGFVQTISLTRAPGEARSLAYAAEHIVRGAKRFAPEFTAVTDIGLSPENEHHKFIAKAFEEFNITPVPLDNFAVWVAKLRPMLQ